MHDDRGAMPAQYALRSLSGDRAVQALEMHVLARAYHAAWSIRYGHAPSGTHLLGSLDLVIDFGPSPTTRAGVARARRRAR
jgi:hypothetical protein